MSGGGFLSRKDVSVTRHRKRRVGDGEVSRYVSQQCRCFRDHIHTQFPTSTQRGESTSSLLLPKSRPYAAASSPSPSFFASPSPSPSAPSFSASSFSFLSFSSSFRCLSAARIFLFSSASALSFSFLARNR